MEMGGARYRLRCCQFCAWRFRGARGFKKSVLLFYLCVTIEAFLSSSSSSSLSLSPSLVAANPYSSCP